ncbi:hypothetical protein ABPG72_009929 [Tetrahymena utriculariae]
MKQINGVADQKSEAIQHIMNLYDQRGDILFNKVSTKFTRIKDLINYTKGQIDILFDGICNIEKEALGKVQYIIMDNHPRHGLPEEALQKLQNYQQNKLNLGIGKQKNSISSKAINNQCEEIIQELADVTLDVIDKKINTFVEIFTANLDQVNAKIDSLIKQITKKNVFKSNFDPISKKITNRDVIWVDYEGITLTQNDKLLFDKSSRTAFNKVDVEHTRDIIIESEKNRDGECTITDVRNALSAYYYTPSYLELRLSYLDKIKEKDINKVFEQIKPFFNLEELYIDFSNWQFSIFEDENRYVSSLCEALRCLPALQVLHLNISNMKGEQCENDLDIVDETIYKLCDTLRGLKLINDLSLNLEGLKSSLTSNSFCELIKLTSEKQNIKYLSLNFGEWCDLNSQIDSYDCMISLCNTLQQAKKLLSLDLNLLSFSIDFTLLEESLLELTNLSHLILNVQVISYDDKSYSQMLISIAKNMYLSECDIKSISIIGNSSFNYLENLLKQKAQHYRQILRKFAFINRYLGKCLRKEIIWDIFKKALI